VSFYNNCIWNKVQRHKLYGDLNQLPILPQSWKSISIDFIKQLPESKGYTNMLVIVNRLIKQAVFIPTHKSLNVPKLVYLFQVQNTIIRYILEQRIWVCIKIFPDLGIIPRYQVIPYLRALSRGKWPSWTNESVLRVVSASLYQLSTGWLGETTAPSGILL